MLETKVKNDQDKEKKNIKIVESQGELQKREKFKSDDSGHSADPIYKYSHEIKNSGNKEESKKRN